MVQVLLHCLDACALGAKTSIHCAVSRHAAGVCIIHSKAHTARAGTGDELQDAEQMSLMFTAFLGFATYKIAVVAASLSQDSNVLSRAELTCSVQA